MFASKFIVCFKIEPDISVNLFLHIKQESLLQSLYMHPTFTICATVLIILFFYGIHRRVVAPSMLVVFFS